MVEDIKIILYQDSNHLHYFPGSKVSGAVVVAVGKPEDYDSIVVKLIGRADVHWTEPTRSGEHECEAQYTNHITYINERYVLWSKEKESLRQLHAGESTFPFQHHLPDNIPPSFEGFSGTVRYEIRAKIVKKGLLKVSHEVKAFLMVRERPDLTGLWMQPQMFDKASRVNCLCFNFGSMSMICNMPRTAFSPGDTIPISVHIENLTTKKVCISAFLQRKDTFTAHFGHEGYLRKQFSPSVTSAPIHAGEITSFDGQSVQIPPEVPATIRSCSCISVEYTVVITAVIPLMPSVTMKIPVVVQHKR